MRMFTFFTLEATPPTKRCLLTETIPSKVHDGMQC